MEYSVDEFGEEVDGFLEIVVGSAIDQYIQVVLARLNGSNLKLEIGLVLGPAMRLDAVSFFLGSSNPIQDHWLPVVLLLHCPIGRQAILKVSRMMLPVLE